VGSSTAVDVAVLAVCKAVCAAADLLGAARGVSLHTDNIYVAGLLIPRVAGEGPTPRVNRVLRAHRDDSIP
jgi:hypothetical protein